jgi:hypothetical protein
MRSAKCVHPLINRSITNHWIPSIVAQGFIDAAVDVVAFNLHDRPCFICNEADPKRGVFSTRKVSVDMGVSLR